MATASTCPYCGVGCGVLIQSQQASEARENRAASENREVSETSITVQGDPDHPANFGRLCVKGSALGQSLSQQERLLQPVVDGAPQSWPVATQAVATRLQQTIARHGPQSVAMYLSGQLLTEDYYVANKLMKGFIGSPHVDTNSRLCMASTVAGHKRAFGADVVPGCYDDIEQARLFVLVGANMAWNHPVLFQRIQAVLKQQPKSRLVVIDPRHQASCEEADLHLAIRPGTDVMLFNGLLCYLAEQQQLDMTYLQAHCDGLAATLSSARLDAVKPEWVARVCDLPLADVLRFYQWFANENRSLTLYSQGVNQAVDGTDKVNAILNVHLATGRIGKPGAGPLSLTGQPNAMGGREVGGLANQLASHIDYSVPEQIAAVGAFWQAPALVTQPGYKAVELFQAVQRGDIKAIWIIGTNPVVSMPDADAVRQALLQCPLVIASDIYHSSDTVQLADIQLPAAGWSEKDGTVTNSERRISRQRAVLKAPGQAKADWQILSEVAAAMGFARDFSYQQPADIFAEHAALSAWCNGAEHMNSSPEREENSPEQIESSSERAQCQRRAFDISGLQGLSAEAYQALLPVQWPVNREYPAGCARLFADGRFFTANGRAQLLPVRQVALPSFVQEANHPWLLNSGRIRDQWHSMTRTGQIPQLMQQKAEPFVCLHPDDAALLSIKAADLVQLNNAQGRMLARAELTAAQRRGELFVPMHWTAQYSSHGRCDVLFVARVDPLSGQPALKLSQVAVRPLRSRWQALLLCRQPLTKQQHQQLAGHYFARQPLAHAQCYQLADVPDTELLWADSWLAQLGLKASLYSYQSDSGEVRAAGFDGDALQWLLLWSAQKPKADLAWLDQQFATDVVAEQRPQLLQACAADNRDTDNSAVICSCFQVREARICQAIEAGQQCLDSLGQKLRCGTNCGSCIPELTALLRQHSRLAVAS
ncbi:nitrate reductase [Alkalimonas sp. NCh-2]|uniref:nitrate reductase n=1 Tax=Alkalimonas sp. NCh-2 TaxID=3144846 RepID=UPI0031F60582